MVMTRDTKTLNMSVVMIDNYTKLIPYDGTLYSPVKRPARVGELAITMSEPRGYCVVVDSIASGVASVYFLDSHAGRIKYDLKSLIPTGKTPQTLLELYEPTSQGFAQALERERQQVDYSTLKSKPSKSTTKKKFDIKNLTPEQKQQVASLLRQLMKGG